MTTSGYNPDDYWTARGGESYQTYTESREYAPYRQAQVQFFERLVRNLSPQTLLDFGCGTGKLFPLWTAAPEVHAYDRALTQLEVARREASRVRPGNPYRIMALVTDDRAGLPYDDNYFDLIAAVEVLLHVVPDDAGRLIAELHRICRGHLAIVTAAPVPYPAPHCFNHDYAALFEGRFEIMTDHCLLQQRYLVGAKTGVAPSPATGAETHALITP